MNIRILAVPYDSGVRGWRMGAGPERLLEAGLEQRLRAAGHAVSTEMIELPAAPAPEVRAAFDLAGQISRRVTAARAARALPLVLAGNCASSLGTLAALARAEPAVFWLDAHGDFNTPETSASGMFDGMALAVATGRCHNQMAARIPGFRRVPDRRISLWGTRATDEAEDQLLADSGLSTIAPTYAPHLLSLVMDEMREMTSTAYLHVDLDLLNPDEGTANGFAAPGGLSLDHVLDLVRVVRAGLDLGALALTAYDPSFDPDGRISAAALRIAETAVAPA